MEKIKDLWKNAKAGNGKAQFMLYGGFAGACIIIASIILLITIPMGKPKPIEYVEIPDLVGMTFQEAEKEVTDAGCTIEKLDGSSDSNDAIVTKQQGKYDNYNGKRVEKGGVVKVKVLTQEEIEVAKEKEQKEQEEKSTINKAIRNFTDKAEKDNDGSVKYSNYQFYDISKNGVTVYKIKYTTSSQYTYYYQLVSLSEDNTRVTKSSKLLEFMDIGKGETGLTQELDYAFKSIF